MYSTNYMCYRHKLSTFNFNADEISKLKYVKFRIYVTNWILTLQKKKSHLSHPHARRSLLSKSLLYFRKSVKMKNVVRATDNI